MALRYSFEDRAKIAVANQIKGRARREAKRERGPKVEKGPTRDRDYLAWLHQGIPCFACLIEGPPKHTHANPIEAAHIWLCEGMMKGLRNSDQYAMAICRFHHREDRDACDINQRNFFDRLGVDPFEAHDIMYGAFLHDRDGFWAAHEIAGRAKAAVTDRKFSASARRGGSHG